MSSPEPAATAVPSSSARAPGGAGEPGAGSPPRYAGRAVQVRDTSAGSSARGGPVRREPVAAGPGWTLLVVCVTVFMLVLDITVVAVALADIQQDLGGDLASLQWVIDAYTLTLAGALLTAATLGDRIGRRRVFVWGLALFTAASAGCAAAWSPLSLDIIRGVQGVGGALLFGTALPLIGSAFTTEHERTKAIGAFGAALTAATAVGPLVGGLLVSGAGWRWIFLVNLPIGALALLASPLMIPSRAAAPRAPDWTGTALLTGFLLAGVLGLIRGNPDGWTSPQVGGLLATAAVLGTLFVARELTAPEPMLDLSLFLRPRFTGIGLGSFVSSATLGAATAYLALFLQNGLGFSPLQTGVRVLPLTLAAFVAAPATALVLRRVPLWPLVAIALGLSGIGLLLTSRVGPTSAWTVFLPGFVVGGIGLGVTGAVMSAGALGAVEQSRSGMATGAVNTLRQIGVAAGMAWLGALFQSGATERGEELLGAVPLPAAARAKLADAVGSGAGAQIAETVPAPLRQAVAAAGRTAAAESLSRTLLVAGLVAVVVTVVCTVLVAGPGPEPVTDGAEPQAAPVPRAAAGAGPAAVARAAAVAPAAAVAQHRTGPTPALTRRGTGLLAALKPRVADGRLGHDRSSRAAERGPARSQRVKGEGRRMTRNEELTVIVTAMRQAVPELYGVMIASMDGLPIAHDFPESEAERVAAMAAMAVGLGKRITERVSLGGVNETVVRGDLGYLMVYPAGDNGVLVMSGPASSNLGLMRLEARAASREVARVLV